MQGENNSYRLFPADPDAGSAFLSKSLYILAIVSFAIAVFSGGHALQDYSQGNIWKPAIATVQFRRDVCRFRYANPRRKRVTVDHDVYCADKERMAEYPSTEYHMTLVTELGVSFRNASNREVLTKIKALAEEVRNVVPGAKIKIKFSVVSESDASLARTVGQEYNASAKIFFASFSVFLALAYFLTRRVVSCLREQKS